MLLGVEKWSAASIVLVLGGLALVSCNVFRSVDRCATDADCGRGNSCDVRNAYCKLTEPVRVGSVLSLSGNLKLRAQGQACKGALEFVREFVAAQEIRPLDRGFDIQFEDDQSDPVLSAASAKSLEQAGVLLVLGALTSPQTLEMQKVTGPARLLQIAPFAGASAVGQAQGPRDERFLFSLSPTIANGSPLALVKYLVEQNATAAGPQCRSTVVVHNDDVTGADFYCTFASRFRTNGMCVRKRVPLSTSLKDSYAAEVTAIVAAKPDCVILAVNPDIAGAVLEEVERRFVPPVKTPWTWLGNSQTHTPELLQTTTIAGTTPRSRAEGFRGADVDYSPRRAGYAQMLALYNEYLAAHGQSTLVDLPTRFSPCADLGMLAALTIEKAGPSPTPEGIRDAFIDVATFRPGDTTVTPAQFVDGLRLIRRGVPVDYKGAASDAELTDEGMNASSPFNIWQVTGGAFDERVRQYDDGETQSVTVTTEVTPNCPAVQDCP